MNFHRMTRISLMPNLTGLAISIQNTTNVIQILTKSVSAAEDMAPGSFHAVSCVLRH